MTEQRRGRGRPPADDAGDRRAAILDVARSRFAAEGFAGTSLRGIARDAGVDVSLISHYFGDKSRLLIATMELPVNPVDKIAAVIADGPTGMAVRLVRTFLDSWDPHADVFSTVMRSALGPGGPHPPMLQLAQEVVVTALRGALEGDDRELRATLVAGQLIGLATLRYVVRVEPLASADADEVVRVYAPGLQRLVDGAPTT